MPEAESAPDSRRVRLRELARLFLLLGTTAFGGPAAHIAMMEDEVVTRRQWLTREQFLDLVGATNLIPGPNSTELAIHVGLLRGGWPGLVVAGACFILPAALIVTALAWLYVRVGAVPELAGVLYGVKPVVLAVVAQALWRLGHSAVRTPTLGILAIVAVAAVLTGLNELVVLAVCGVLAAIVARGSASTMTAVAPLGAAPAAVVGAGIAGGVASIGLWPIFWFFAKVGSVLFGSGYVLLAFLRSGLVVDRAWLTEAQLLDAIAIGQVTPGPVFTTATFVGYLLAGGGGAAVATLGIFLPAFFFVAVSGPLVPRIRRSRTAGAVLDGVNVASLALMAVVTVRLAGTALVDLPTIGLAVASAVLLVATRLNSAFIVVGGAVVGVALSLMR
jgi:chromate transporter